MRQRLRPLSSLSRLAAAALAAALLGGGAVTGALLPATVHAQDAVRPEVGKPLQAAQELIRARKFEEALAKVREADAVGGKTANENFLIERMRLAAASGAGDADTAAKSYEAIAARLSGAD